MYFQQSKMNKLFAITFVSLVFLFVLLVPTLAQNLGGELINETAAAADIGGANLPTILGKIFKIVLSVLGLIALVIIIVAGIQWMTSGGIPEKIKKARALLSAGLIGLLIIILAYAMVSFIISSLGGVTTGGTGCNVGDCCGDGYAWDSNCECNDWVYPRCATGQSQEYFRLAYGEADFRSPMSGDYTIYMCSKIRAVFNHVIDQDTFDVALANSTLKVVDADNNPVAGSFTTTGKSILFTPTNLWIGENTYRLIIPKTISDSNGKSLVGCVSGFIPPYACTGDDPTATTVDWEFSTNDELDEISPYIDHAYPIMDVDNSLYPDRNVSRAPMIDVIFNENIDYATIIDMNHIDYDASDLNTWHPIGNHFQLCKIDDQGSPCVIGNEYDNDNLIIAPISQGFRIFVTNAQWLDTFTWYEIQVDKIYDMCNNRMLEAQLWVFETNNNVPGAQDWWPTGDNVCPDALIGIRFATSMYEYKISVEVINNDTGDVEFAGFIEPSDLYPGGPDGEYEATLDTGNGSIKVMDDDDENISNQFKIFQLELNDTLKSNKPYTVIFDTDLVINVDGDELDKEWDFEVTNMEYCACAPIIYQVLPNNGARQSCVTITGHCFEGTTERTASIDELWFDDTQDPPPANGQQFIDGHIEANIENNTANSIVTIIPEDYGDPLIDEYTADIPDFLGTGIKIIYEDNSEEVETFSENQFTVIDNALAQGPCIWRLLPNTGYITNEFDIDGIQFCSLAGTIEMGTESGLGYNTWQKN